MVYVMSDIHGQYKMYSDIMEQIQISDNDKFYILGDAIDRGNYGIEILCDIMSRKNVIYIMGNHDVMFLDVLETYGIENRGEEEDPVVKIWFLNGGAPTYEAFLKLSMSKRLEIFKFLKNCPYFAEETVDGRLFRLSHSYYDFDTIDENDRIRKDNNTWHRITKGSSYLIDRGIVIFGHTCVSQYHYNYTPYFEIDGIDALWSEMFLRNPKPKKGFIGIDTGCAILGDEEGRKYFSSAVAGMGIGPRLTCLRLDDGEIYYAFYDWKNAKN